VTNPIGVSSEPISPVRAHQAFQELSSIAAAQNANRFYSEWLLVAQSRRF
jgi:hypothetical protein